MRVPVVTSHGAGKFRSKMPLAAISTTALLKPQPDFLEYVRQAQEVTLEAGYERYAKIIASDGQLLARVENDGDGFAVAEVTLADTPPQPTAAQPEMRLPEIARFIIDVVGVSALIPTYRDGVRRQWGEQTAPPDPRTKAWTWAVAGVAAGAAVIGFMFGRRR
jgi:hypothetical protein